MGILNAVFMGWISVAAGLVIWLGVTALLERWQLKRWSRRRAERRPDSITLEWDHSWTYTSASWDEVFGEHASWRAQQLEQMTEDEEFLAEIRAEHLRHERGFGVTRCAIDDL